MEIIRLHHPYLASAIPQGPVVLVLGFFDGLHRGHQQVIATGKKIATEKGLPLTLMTFNQHPSIVFKKFDENITKYLTPLREKETLLAGLGIDRLYEVEFTSAFAKLAPQAFVDQYMVGLNAAVVVCGFDYSYGPKDVANVAALPTFAKERFEVIAVPRLDEDGVKVSSTRIRENLASGNMTEVTSLLGRVYTTSGVVVHGEARGRQLGYPTANVLVSEDVRLPKIGVYATRVLVNGQWYPSMTSIGHNDTFGEGRELTVEANLFDFHQEIYGEHVTISWDYFLRDQVKFASGAALIKQLAQDEQDAQRLLTPEK